MKSVYRNVHWRLSVLLKIDSVNILRHPISGLASSARISWTRRPAGSVTIKGERKKKKKKGSSRGDLKAGIVAEGMLEVIVHYNNN